MNPHEIIQAQVKFIYDLFDLDFNKRWKKKKITHQKVFIIRQNMEDKIMFIEDNLPSEFFHSRQKGGISFSFIFFVYLPT